ncbi:TetR family transcriptional regulator [Lysobacter korlensis]|uniref:TetR family transcriptional regulator n=1 Tax=Lysobacter korlensis TaxID=553636 RepID=A0ABV6S1U0_9GAMM
MARRTASATRESIRSAASTLFRQQGYAGTSVREIAALAEVDPALVIRHFGAKQVLFLETMHVTLDDEPLFDVPIESLGRRFIEVLLDSDEDVRGAYLALVRGSAESEIAQRLTTVHNETFVAPLRNRLSGPDADLRARLAAALVGGLLYALWVVGDEQLLATDHADIADRYGRLLQDILTPRD